MIQHFLDKIRKIKLDKITFDLLSELIVSVPKKDKCRSGEIKPCTQFTLVTNTKIAEARIVSSIFTVILNRTRPDLLAEW